MTGLDPDIRWRNLAACAGMAAFEHQTLAEQRATCAGCPVTAECLALGLETTDGIATFCKPTECVHAGYTVAEMRTMLGAKVRADRLAALPGLIEEGLTADEIVAQWGGLGRLGGPMGQRAS